MIKAEFSASLFQSSVSHNPSEINLILLAAQETFLIIIAAHICVEIVMHFSELILHIVLLICNVM